MNIQKRIQTMGSDLLKGILSAIASAIGMMAGSIAAQALKLPAMEMPGYMNLMTLFPLMLLSWVLISIMLGKCFQTLYRSYWQRVLGIWLCNYLLYSALNTLDSLLFMPIPNITTSFFTNAINALVASLMIASLWRPQPTDPPQTSIQAHFSARTPRQWLWRFIVAWLLYAPIYYLMGRVAGLFTQQYYEDPSLNLGLTLPPVETMMGMQILRGALFLLAVLPIILRWNGTRLTLFLWVGGVIFLQISAQTMIQAYWFPWDLRIPHTLELLADSFLQAALYVSLLAAPRKLISFHPKEC